MTSFGHKIGWLAFSDPSTPREVAALLSLTYVRASTWPDAVAAAYREWDEVLVTPSLRGADSSSWILVCGRALMTDELDLAALSAHTDGEVQWFVTHRVNEAHGWARARGGQLIRSFMTVGDTGTTTSTGVRDPAEVTGHVDEDTVMKQAGRWSVNPQILSDVPHPPPPFLARVPSAPPPPWLQ